MDKYYKIIELIYDFSVVTTSFPALISLLRWRNFDSTLRAFAIHTWKGAVISITALFAYYQGLSNRPFYFIDGCLDILLISGIAALIVKKGKFSLLVTIISVAYSGVMIYDYFHDRTDKLINTQLASLESIYVIVLMLVLLRMVSIREGTNRYKNSLIWLLSATLVSNLFSLLVSSLNEIALDYSSELFKLLWYISAPLVIIITNGILCYAYLLPKNINRRS